MRALAKIALAHPGVAPQILDVLIAAADRFPGNRVGFVVESMAAFAGFGALAPRARAFAESYVQSDVRSVATKARRTVKKLGRASCLLEITGGRPPFP